MMKGFAPHPSGALAPRPSPGPRLNPTFSPADYWNQLADRYQSETIISTRDFHFGPLLPGDRSLGLLPRDLQGLDCLEAGCGAGQNSLYLASQGARCQAFDVAEAQIAHARKLSRKANLPVDFRVDDMDGDFHAGRPPVDLVHSTFALPFSEDPARFIWRCAKALKPGGLFLLTTSHPVYAGEWLEVDEDEDGVFIADYFHPQPDIRQEGDDTPRIRSQAWPLGQVAEWLSQAGFVIERLLEPQPVNVDLLEPSDLEDALPYFSLDWLNLYPALKRFPTVAIFRCRLPS